jgi:hypothetical protein
MSLRVGFLYFVVVSLLLAMDVVASIQVATTGTYYTRVLEGFVNKHFFKFPKDHIQHQIWKDICKIDISKSSKFATVCEDHFDDSAFLNENRNRLNFRAVPLPVADSVELCLLDDLLLPDLAESSNVVSPGVEPRISSHSKANDVTCNMTDSIILDNNCLTENDTPFNVNKFAFLGKKSRDGILTKIGCSKDFSPGEKLIVIFSLGFVN